MGKAQTKEKPERSLRIHQAVARELGIGIVSGEYAPGDRIPVEIEEAENRGVSRTAYREALRILAAKGLIESRPKAGTHVTAREQWNLLDPDVLAWMFVGEPDEALFRDIWEIRYALEPLAARLAAERRTDNQLETMRLALNGMAQWGLAMPEGQRADQQFHRAILAASGNLALASLGASIGAAVRWTTQFKQRATPSPRDPHAEHEAVFEAIRDRDRRRAARTMVELLDLALADLEVAVKVSAKSARG